MKKIPLFIYIFTISVFAQNQPAESIIKKTIDKLNGVKDFSAEVFVKIEADFIKAPDSKAEIFYKAPNKFKVNSEKFAMIPKQGFGAAPVSFLKEEGNSILTGFEYIDGFECYKIKFIPLSDTGYVLISTFWIDKKEYVARKIESATKGSGVISFKLEYGEHVEYALPDKTIFEFEGKMGAIKNITPNGNKSPETKNLTGKVILYYSNYKINTNLPDIFFE